MDQVQAAFWAAPPVTRTLTALALVQSALVYSGVLSGYHVLFLPHFILKLFPQIWRLATPFLLTGPKLQFFFDLYFMFHYGSQLETSSARFSQPGEFLIYLIFVACTILLTAGFLMGGMIFTSALILAFIYTYAQDNRGRRATVFFVDIPMEYLPWAMLLLSFVVNGQNAALKEATGIAAAHLYDFLTRIYPRYGGGRNYITTPAAVERFFARHTPDVGNRGYGRAYRQPQQSESSRQASQAPSRGWTSSSQDPWGNRGAGRRLGGS